jgi:hypothetical protein
MQLTATLINSLNRVWKRDPKPVQALRLTYPGGVLHSWTVKDLLLTTSVSGGAGAPLEIDLTSLTVGGLLVELAGQAGYVIQLLAPGLQDLSAAVLLDGTGDSSAPLLAYTRLSWAFADAMARELDNLETCAALAPQMMVVATAQGEWLDFLGTLFGACQRIPGEIDTLYAARMIAQITAPKGNNVAIEIALETVYGFENVSVADVVIYSGVQTYDGSIHFDGAHHFDAAPTVEYGLYDISGVYAGPYAASVVAPYVSAFLTSLRVGGCHPRNITLTDQGGTPLAITVG